MKDKLKKCPFCGLTAKREEKTLEGKTFYRSICPKCGIKTEWWKTKILSLAVWNRRVNTPKHETVEEWEKRTGGIYPNDGAVWLTIDSELWVTGWQLMTKEYWLLYNNDEQAIVYVANHHGKPEIKELKC